MDGVDLGGKIIFKVKLDNEIKKVIIHNDEINYNEMVLMIQRIFSDRIKTKDEFRIKYADDENDLITIANDSDLAVAIQTTKILKLTILMASGKEEKVEEIKASEIVNELRQLRSGVDSFLNKFERFLKLDSEQKSAKIEVESSRSTTNASAAPTTNGIKTSNSNTVILNDIQKEFDPLLNKKSELDSQQKFQPIQKHSRADTPDSIGSSEFTLSQKTHTATITVGSSDVTSSTTNNHFDHYHQQQQQLQQQQQQQQPPQQLVNQVQVQHPSQQQQQQQQPQQQPQAQFPPQQQYNPLQQQQQQPQYPQPAQMMKYPGQQQPQQQQVPGMPLMPVPGMMQQPQQTQPQQQPQYPPQQQFQKPPGSLDPGAGQQQQQQQQLQHPQAPQAPQQQAYQQQPAQFYQNPGVVGQPQQPGLGVGGPQPTTIMGMSPVAGYSAQQGQQPYGQSPQQPGANANPYSTKTHPNSSLARPPSASMYQQGYK